MTRPPGRWSGAIRLSTVAAGSVGRRKESEWIGSRRARRPQRAGRSAIARAFVPVFAAGVGSSGRFQPLKPVHPALTVESARTWRACGMRTVPIVAVSPRGRLCTEITSGGVLVHRSQIRWNRPWLQLNGRSPTAAGQRGLPDVRIRDGAGSQSDCPPAGMPKSTSTTHLWSNLVDVRGHVRLINGIIFRIGTCVDPAPPPDPQAVQVTHSERNDSRSRRHTPPEHPLRLDDLTARTHRNSSSLASAEFSDIVITDTRAQNLALDSFGPGDRRDVGPAQPVIDASEHRTGGTYCRPDPRECAARSWPAT